MAQAGYLMSGTEQSKALLARALQVTPGGVHSPVRAFTGVGGTPPFMQSGSGACLKDVDGNEYVDFCQSFGPLIFGHCDPDIQAAATAAISQGTSFGAADTASLALAELITSHIPWCEKIRFVNSGTEAVMTALRIARGVTGRSKVLKFTGGYHGHTDAMLVKAGSGLAAAGQPDSAGVSEQTSAETLVANFDDPDSVARLFAEQGSDIAAVIIEPVPANYGLLIQRPKFLQHLAELTKKNGALLVFDEVISGFRLSFGGAAAVFDIAPDLVTYGKIIGGGFPVGAVGGRAEYLDRLAPLGDVYQAGTLSANPVAMSAGLAALNKLLTTDPYAQLAQQTQQLAARLSAAVASTEGVRVHVQQMGSLFWPVFSQTEQREPIRRPEDIPATHREIFARVFHRLLDAGIYLPPSAVEVCFLSTAHTPAQCDALVSAFSDALNSL